MGVSCGASSLRKHGEVIRERRVAGNHGGSPGPTSWQLVGEAQCALQGDRAEGQESWA